MCWARDPQTGVGNGCSMATLLPHLLVPRASASMVMMPSPDACRCSGKSCGQRQMQAGQPGLAVSRVPSTALFSVFRGLPHSPDPGGFLNILARNCQFSFRSWAQQKTQAEILLSGLFLDTFIMLVVSVRKANILEPEAKKKNHLVHPLLSRAHNRRSPVFLW